MNDLTDYEFEVMGFDISKEPFTKEYYDSNFIVHKNYKRNGSGEYDGYLITVPRYYQVKTMNDLLEVISNKDIC